MQLVRPQRLRPSSIGVIYGGPVLEAVVTSIPYGATKVVEGGFREHGEEAFRQMAELLAECGIAPTNVCSVRVYLQDVLRDAAEMNRQWKAFFDPHAPSRRCYGVQLQAGMLIEMAFVAECPAGAARRTS